jgi:hypothetical protein
MRWNPSREPEKAVAAAELLMELAPDASHLVHMPAHIFVRVGRWADAAEANNARWQLTSFIERLIRAPAFTSMMRGRSEETVRLARELMASAPPDFIEDRRALP